MPPKDLSITPPSSPMLMARQAPEPDDIPEPAVPAAVLAEVNTPHASSSLPEGFGAHEALLQGFCQHLQDRLHTFMLEEHKGIMQTLDATLVALRKWVETVGQQNEHSAYQLSDALFKLQEQGILLMENPYKVTIEAVTPEGYPVKIDVVKRTTEELIMAMPALSGWLAAQGYTMPSPALA